MVYAPTNLPISSTWARGQFVVPYCEMKERKPATFFHNSVEVFISREMIYFLLFHTITDYRNVMYKIVSSFVVQIFRLILINLMKKIVVDDE